MGLSIQQDMYVQTLKAQVFILDARLQGMDRFTFTREEHNINRFEKNVLIRQIMDISEEIKKWELGENNTPYSKLSEALQIAADNDFRISFGSDGDVKFVNVRSMKKIDQIDQNLNSEVWYEASDMSRCSRRTKEEAIILAVQTVLKLKEGS